MYAQTIHYYIIFFNWYYYCYYIHIFFILAEYLGQIFVYKEERGKTGHGNIIGKLRLRPRSHYNVLSILDKRLSMGGGKSGAKWVIEGLLENRVLVRAPPLNPTFPTVYHIQFIHNRYLISVILIYLYRREK